MNRPTTRVLARLACLVALIVAALVPAQARNSDDSPHILFVVAAESDGTGDWHEAVDSHALPAAEALGITLEHHYVSSERTVILSRMEERLSRTPSAEHPEIDYIVFANQRGTGRELLEMAQGHGIDTFLYIAPLTNADREALGGPRGKLSHWIGELIPDDEQAGYDLAVRLIADAKTRKAARGDLTPVRMIAVHGRRSTTASLLRAQGLDRALLDHPEVDFLQGVSGRWDDAVAAWKYKRLQGRHGRIDVVWSANDGMALAVLNTHLRGVHIPSIGGMDWNERAVGGIADGSYAVSMGGHAFDIAHVFALLRAHHDGTDFADAAGTASLASKLVAMTPDDVASHSTFERRRAAGRIDYALGLAGVADDADALADLSLARFKRAAQ